MDQSGPNQVPKQTYFGRCFTFCSRQWPEFVHDTAVIFLQHKQDWSLIIKAHGYKQSITFAAIHVVKSAKTFGCIYAHLPSEPCPYPWVTWNLGADWLQRRTLTLNLTVPLTFHPELDKTKLQNVVVFYTFSPVHFCGTMEVISHTNWRKKVQFENPTDLRDFTPAENKNKDGG